LQVISLAFNFYFLLFIFFIAICSLLIFHLYSVALATFCPVGDKMVEYVQCGYIFALSVANGVGCFPADEALGDVCPVYFLPD
jgi:hypothetical protein